MDKVENGDKQTKMTSHKATIEHQWPKKNKAEGNITDNHKDNSKQGLPMSKIDKQKGEEDAGADETEKRLDMKKLVTHRLCEH